MRHRRALVRACVPITVPIDGGGPPAGCSLAIGVRQLSECMQQKARAKDPRPRRQERVKPAACAQGARGMISNKISSKVSVAGEEDAVQRTRPRAPERKKPPHPAGAAAGREEINTRRMVSDEVDGDVGCAGAGLRAGGGGDASSMVCCLLAGSPLPAGVGLLLSRLLITVPPVHPEEIARACDSIQEWLYGS